MSSEDLFNGRPRRLLNDFRLLLAHYRLRSGTRQRANNRAVSQVPGYSPVTPGYCSRAEKGILVRNTCAANLCKTQMVTVNRRWSSGVTEEPKKRCMFLCFIVLQGMSPRSQKSFDPHSEKCVAKGFDVSTAFSTVFGVREASPLGGLFLHNSFIFQWIWPYYLKVTNTRFRTFSDRMRPAQHAHGKQQDCP